MEYFSNILSLFDFSENRKRMNSVWILYENDYDADPHICTFSTEKEAQCAQKLLSKTVSGNNFVYKEIPFGSLPVKVVNKYLKDHHLDHIPLLAGEW